ncbi:hypothetical protein BDW62DRAFT_128730 [Aspergillus aurantiobrunneus]
MILQITGGPLVHFNCMIPRRGRCVLRRHDRSLEYFQRCWVGNAFFVFIRRFVIMVQFYLLLRIRFYLLSSAFPYVQFSLALLRCVFKNRVYCVLFRYYGPLSSHSDLSSRFCFIAFGILKVRPMYPK